MSNFLFFIVGFFMLIGSLCSWFGAIGKAKYCDKETEIINEAQGDDSFHWFASGAVFLMLAGLLFIITIVLLCFGVIQ